MSRTSSILAVDDNEDARTTLSWILRANKFDVWEAGTAQEALRLVNRQPALVLLDVVLPDLSGWEVCRRIKQNAATALTPVVMVSGVATEVSDRVRGLDNGADEYLVKPVEPQELLAHVRALLRVREFEEQALAAKEKAAASERRLRAIIDTEPACVMLVSGDGVVLDMNPAGLRILGAEHLDQVKSKRIWSMIAPGNHSEVRRAFKKALSGGVEEVRFEASDLSGKRLWLESRLTKIALEDAGAVILAITHDVTEKTRLESHFRQSQKMDAIGQLAGGIAHDFNNLLTVILGCTQLALARMTPDPEIEELLGDVQAAGERAATLTRQLLTFSRKQILAPRVLDINAVVTNMKNMLGRIIGEHIRLKTALEPELWHVKIDPGQLEQVVMNLAVNARDAMPNGGVLTIETHNLSQGPRFLPTNGDGEPGLFVLMAVSDTGLGMSKQLQGRIFEPFFTTKDVGEGTGLGLATVYGIVRQSGGHVEVYSEVGQGSSFKVYLPVADEPFRCNVFENLVSELSAGTETILLAEDDESVRSLSQDILARAGYKVLTAANGAEALKLSQEHGNDIHLLITDVVMPEMSGRQLAEKLLELRPGIKVLYVSGYSDDAAVQHGILKGAMTFLAKPFGPTSLRVKVREVLDSVSGQ